MPSEEWYQAYFEKTYGPYLESDECKPFLIGQAYQASLISNLSRESPATAQSLKDLLTQFTWELISIPKIQTELQVIFDSNKCLQQPDLISRISPFLQAELKTMEDEVTAKQLLCDCFGMITQKGNQDTQAKMEETTKFMQEVIDRHQDQTEWVEQFLSLMRGTKQGEGPDTRRGQLLKMLEDQKDLWERFQVVIPVLPVDSEFQSFVK